jgi:hypothetical protein
MLNDKIILDNVEYKKMIEDLEAFKKEKEKRQIYRKKYYKELTDEEKQKRLLYSQKYYKELTEEQKQQRKQNLKIVKYTDLTEEQKQQRKAYNLDLYYKKMLNDEGKEEIRKRAREYYQNKIKTDPDKYNKIKERQKIKYETTKHEKKETPREFVNLVIAAY